MQLYASPASPFARKARVVLIETGQDDVEVVTVQAGVTGAEPRLAAAAPLRKIPVLVRDDAPNLYDSRVICRFLDARGVGGLYPETRLWEVLTLEALADGLMEAALSCVYERRFRPEDKQWDGWIEAQWGKVQAALAALETLWLGHLRGPLDMAGIAVGCALGYLDLRHGDRDWRAGHDGLAVWFARISERPSFQQTEPA